MARNFEYVIHYVIHFVGCVRVTVSPNQIIIINIIIIILHLYTLIRIRVVHRLDEPMGRVESGRVTILPNFGWSGDFDY